MALCGFKEQRITASLGWRSGRRVLAWLSRGLGGGRAWVGELAGLRGVGFSLFQEDYSLHRRPRKVGVEPTDGQGADAPPLPGPGDCAYFL